MKRINGEQWGAAAGFLSLAVGSVAMSFERGAPGVGAAAETMIAYLGRYRTELLVQSLLLVIAVCLSIPFHACLRSYLRRAEGGNGTVSTLAFTAACLNAGLQLTFQGVQVAMVTAVDSVPSMAAALGILGWTLSVVAYAPFALMLAAVALLSLRKKAFPVWLGILSAAAAAANVLMLFGIVARDGILAPGGVLTYAAYAFAPVWFVSAAILLFRRLRTRVQ